MKAYLFTHSHERAHSEEEVEGKEKNLGNAKVETEKLRFDPFSSFF